MSPDPYHKFSVTLDHYSPAGIVFSSRQGSYWYHILLLAFGAFLMVFGLTDMYMLTISSYPMAMIAFFAGTALTVSVLRIRLKAIELSFLSATRQIVGIPKHTVPLRFSDVQHFLISCNRDLWRISMVLKNRETWDLVSDYPLNVALRIAQQLGKMVGVPVMNEKGQPIKSDRQLDWRLLLPLPQIRFQLEYMVLAGSLAAVITILSVFYSAGVFSIDVAPKWLLLLALAFPGGQLVTNLNETRGLLFASIVSFLFLFLFAGLGLLSLFEPSLTFLGLIPISVFLLIIITMFIEGHKMTMWFILGTCCVGSCVLFILFTSYNFHTFFHLDHSVVEFIDLEWDQNRQIRIEHPYEIKELLQTLQKASLQKNRLEPKSAPVSMRISRPAGRNYSLELHREGSGRNTQAAYKLSCYLFGIKIFLGTVSSTTMDTALSTQDVLHGFWPPRN